jgi:competence protein ComGC
MEFMPIRWLIAKRSGKNSRWWRRAAGFTMIEVLISTTILVIVVVMLSQMLHQMGGIWLFGHARVERSEGGRAILEFISRELQAAQLPVDRTAQTSLQFVVNPVTTGTTTYKNRDAIFWQAPLATDQTFGDLAEIGYFVQWDETTIPTNPHAHLCRFFVNPTDPSNPANPYYMIYSAPTDWVNDTVIKAVAPADKTNANNPYQGLFVENVLGLWVTCLDPTGKTIKTDCQGAAIPDDTFDSRNGYSYTDITGTSVPSQPPTQKTCALPAAIDVSFVVLDSTSAKQVTPALESAIRTLADAKTNAKDFVDAARTDPTFRLIQAGLQPFMTRVYLNNSK